jgi:hypothetical protein
MITFVTWWWQGWRNLYQPEHVYKTRDAIAKHYKLPHRFVCVTDQPHLLPGVKTCRLWETHSFEGRDPNLPNCYRRLKLFDGEASKFGDRLVSIDIDSIILDDITDLFTDDPFKILSAKCNPYNGSIWQVKPGTHPEVWTSLSKASIAKANNTKMKNGRKYYGSDQAYMAYMLPDAPTWDEKDGIYYYNDVVKAIPDNAKIIFFPGTLNPWDSKYKELYYNG